MQVNIRLPIFHKNDKTRAAELADKEYGLSECDIDTISFYTIDAIGPMVDDIDEKTYCSIFIGKNEFISPISYKEMDKILKQFCIVPEIKYGK